MKSNKGITLVALVITIIVLLILAGVSISMVVGENGVLNRATNAAERTTEADARQELEMAVSSAQSDFFGKWEKNTTLQFLNCIQSSDGTDDTKIKLTADGYYINYSYTSGDTAAGIIYKGKKDGQPSYTFELKQTTNKTGAKLTKWNGQVLGS